VYSTVLVKIRVFINQSTPVHRIIPSKHVLYVIDTDVVSPQAPLNSTARLTTALYDRDTDAVSPQAPLNSTARLTTVLTHQSAIRP
jgi:hypothetical protein